MAYLIGVLGLLVLGGIYVGLGLADRGGGCGDCALRGGEGECDLGASCSESRR